MDGLNACFMDDDDDEDVACAYCEEEADFYCFKCSSPICIEHTTPVALHTEYCDECAVKAGIKLLSEVE